MTAKGASDAPPGKGSEPEVEDLSARARIRDAALTHFAEEGYDRATIRGIAQAAGVSPGLVRHHFGSKEALHKACDDYVVAALRRMNAEMLADPRRSAEARRAATLWQRYLTRALVDGSTTLATIFDEMVMMTEQWLARADEDRSDLPPVERHVRAAVVTAMAAGIPLLHEHVSRALGQDMFGPVGDRLLALALLDIYSHRLITEEEAASAGAGFATGDGPVEESPSDAARAAAAQRHDLLARAGQSADPFRPFRISPDQLSPDGT